MPTFNKVFFCLFLLSFFTASSVWAKKTVYLALFDDQPIHSMTSMHWETHEYRAKLLSPRNKFIKQEDSYAQYRGYIGRKLPSYKLHTIAIGAVLEKDRELIFSKLDIPVHAHYTGIIQYYDPLVLCHSLI